MAYALSRLRTDANHLYHSTTDTASEGIEIDSDGTKNTNLLDQVEMNRIIDELETLPYSNAIEAVEQGTPSVYTNGSLLLYILSIPKLGRSVYNVLLTRAAINGGKQIDLQFDKVLINEAEIYGITGNCLSINNSTVCKGSALTKLKEDDCLSRILRGGSAKCKYRFTREEIVEVLDENVIYLTNFKGSVESNGTTTFLDGTYLLQLSNESVIIRNHTYSSNSIMRTQALPPLFVNITHDDMLLDIKYVHEVSLNNINRIDQLDTRFNSSIGINVIIIGSMAMCIGWLRYHQTKKLNLPKVQFQLSTIDPQICGTQIFKEGGVNSIVSAANKNNSAA